jgi:uncharacterized protein (TIGR03790 family)
LSPSAPFTVAVTLAVAAIPRPGGGPENVLVLYNADVSHPGPLNDPLEIAELYRAARCLPPAHLVPVHGLPEANISAAGVPQSHTISVQEYEAHVLAALDLALATLPHPEDIDILVVVRGLPHRVDLEPDVSAPNDCASLTAMLGVYRTERVGAPGDFLYDEPHPVSIFPPNRRPSIENPYWYGGEYVSGDYPAGDPELPAELRYTTSTGIVRRDLDAGESQAPSFTRAALVPVPLPPAVWGFDQNLFLVTRLDGFDYSDAEALVERGVAADGTFPAFTPAAGISCTGSPCGSSHGAPALLAMAGRDSARRIRDSECRFAIEHLGSSFCSEYVAAHDPDLSGRSLVAYFTGSAALATHFPANGDALYGNCFAPGAIACNLTSNAGSPPNHFCDADGDCPPFDEANGQSSELQTSVARLIRHGVTGAHATVAEPFSHTFPGAGTLLLYTFGYNLAESFFFTQPYLRWQNTYFGDPLATPYAERPTVALSTTSLADNQPLEVTASHPHGIARIRVSVDGQRRADVTLAGNEPKATLVVSLKDLSSGPHSVLAVAYASNSLVERPGWPEPLQLPRPDVQGWTCATLELVENPKARTSAPPGPFQ